MVKFFEVLVPGGSNRYVNIFNIKEVAIYEDRESKKQRATVIMIDGEEIPSRVNRNKVLADIEALQNPI